MQDENLLLRFGFDERFRRQMDPEELNLIRRVKGARDAGLTYREIEARFGVSKSHAARLVKKWTPAMGSEVCEVISEEIHHRDTETRREEIANEECGMTNEECESPQEDADGNPTCTEGVFVEGERLKDEGESEETCESQSTCESPRVSEGDIGTQREETSREDAKTQSEEGVNEYESREPDAPPRRRTIRSLKRAVNAAGTEIFIESENTIGQPEIWYQVDSRGNFVRYRRIVVRREC